MKADTILRSRSRSLFRIRLFPPFFLTKVTNAQTDAQGQPAPGVRPSPMACRSPFTRTKSCFAEAV
jgi:hypothetical protein